VWPGAAQKGSDLSAFFAYDEWDHSLPIDRRIGKASMINKKELLWHLILLGLGVGYLGIFKS
jgi:hypothetical protein